MPRNFTPKVVTANALLEGDVVYLTADDRWTRDLAEAEMLADEAHAQIRLLDARPRAAEVVGAYLADMRARRGRPRAHAFPRGFPRAAARPTMPTASRPELSTALTACKETTCTAIPTSTPPSWPSATRQFRAQVERRIDGSLTEDEFKPLRLMNGLYLQLHAYMLRVAIPYGTLQRGADAPARRYRRALGQGLWPFHHAAEHPVQLAEAARRARHAGRAGRGADARDPDLGNTIRNVTADHFAGAAADEIADPRPVAELIRQWSTDHPEFQFLPRKFKIAVTGSPNDRAVTPRARHRPAHGASGTASSASR